MEMLKLLLYLGRKGALDRFVVISTPKVGKDLKTSQQSVSRWLISLRNDGMLKRKEGLRGYMVQISPKGREYLLGIRKELNKMVASKGKAMLMGNLVSGMLDGKYYLGLRGYADAIEAKLGYRPFPGTLNIKLVSMEDMQFKEKLDGLPGIVIPGFRMGERHLGSLKCFPCRIESTKCAVLIPERSHYGNDIIEIISKNNLRKKLNLSDGDDVKVVVDRSCL